MNMDLYDSIHKAFDETELLFNSQQFDLAVERYKYFLSVDGLPLNFRLIAHMGLAQSLAKDFGGGDALNIQNINREVWIEAATNFDMCAHLYDHFFNEKQKMIEPFKNIRDQAKVRLDIIVLKYGGSVKYFRGEWSTDSSLCPDFRIFEGYPEKYKREK